MNKYAVGMIIKHMAAAGRNERTARDAALEEIRKEARETWKEALKGVLDGGTGALRDGSALSTGARELIIEGGGLGATEPFETVCAFAARIFQRRVAATPRPRRGYLEETSRAAETWILGKSQVQLLIKVAARVRRRNF